MTLVTAAAGLSIPFGVEGVHVESAAQMHAAVSERFDACSMLICAAAVADYTPAHPADQKLSKADGELKHIELIKTQDILADMSARKGNRIVVASPLKPTTSPSVRTPSSLAKVATPSSPTTSPVPTRRSVQIRTRRSGLRPTWRTPCHAWANRPSHSNCSSAHRH